MEDGEFSQEEMEEMAFDKSKSSWSNNSNWSNKSSWNNNSKWNNKKKWKDKKKKRLTGVDLLKFYWKTFKEFHDNVDLIPPTQKEKMKLIANMKKMKKDLGENLCKDFIRMCIMDWQAIRDKVKKEKDKFYPKYPRLVLVFLLRKEIELVKSAKDKTGVISTKHRYSNFASYYDNKNSDNDSDNEELDWLKDD